MNSDMTIAEEMCEELSAEIERLTDEASTDKAIIAAMCAGKMHPQCPGCAAHRRFKRVWVIGGLTMAACGFLMASVGLGWL